MTEAVHPSGAADRPDPETATTPAEFVSTMRRLKDWSGLAYRQLEKRAATAGDALPRSTVTVALTRDTLPREQLVEAFARACGCGEDEARRWVAARRRIAATVGATGPGPVQAGPIQAGTGDAVDPAGADPGPAGPVPPAVRRAGSPARRATAILVGVAAVTLAASVTLTVRDLATRGRAGGPVPDRSQSSAPGTTSGGGPSAGPSWPLPDSSQLNSPPSAPDGKPRILYLGDSLVTETRNVVSFFVHRTGAAGVVAASHPGVSICDYLAGGTGGSLVPAEHKLPVLVKTVQPRVIALQFGMSSPGPARCIGPDPPGTDGYYRRWWLDAQQAVRQVTEAARDAGIARPKLVWVLQGPARDNPQWVRRLNEEIFSAIANAHDDLVSNAGWSVSMAAFPYESVPDGRYRWVQFLPCTDPERQYGYCTAPRAFGGVTQLHRDGDDVHFCLGTMTGSPPSCDTTSPGLVRYGGLIADTLVRYLGSGT
jgi:hypothetical protein